MARQISDVVVTVSLFIDGDETAIRYKFSSGWVHRITEEGVFVSRYEDGFERPFDKVPLHWDESSGSVCIEEFFYPMHVVVDVAVQGVVSDEG